MKKMKISKTLYTSLFVSLLLMAFTSCDIVDDDDIGSTKVVDMAGDWYVKLLDNGGNDIYGLGYQLISTYNTSSNDGTELWIDDRGHTWDFKVKATVNITGFTLSGSDLTSSVDGYDITVNITDGKITKGEVITEGGNPTDGISFNAEFSDDPGTIYTIVGYKRTGFAEDEH